MTKEQLAEKNYPLPIPMVDALIQLGLRTEQGQALMAGYRLGHPDFSPEKGNIKLVSVHAEVTFVPPSQS